MEIICDSLKLLHKEPKIFFNKVSLTQILKESGF